MPHVLHCNLVQVRKDKKIYIFIYSLLFYELFNKLFYKSKLSGLDGLELTQASSVVMRKKGIPFSASALERSREILTNMIALVFRLTFIHV